MLFVGAVSNQYYSRRESSTCFVISSYIHGNTFNINKQLPFNLKTKMQTPFYNL